MARPPFIHQGLRRRTVGAIYAGATDWATFVASQKAAAARPTAGAGPVLVAGFFSEPSGLGRAADLTLLGLRHAGLAPQPLPIRDLIAGDHANLSKQDDGGVLLLHCNPDEAVRVLARTPARAWKSRRRIGYWAWELPVVPPRWRRAAGLFHEVWAPSRFVADALTAGGVKTPIRVMPHPVSLGITGPGRDRARWSLPAEGFAILVMADFRSSATRKNIDGAIEIVRRASQLGSKATLILKMRQADSAHLIHLRQRLGGLVDLRIMTDELDHASTLSLLASVDVLLSPHRSEGFGLALAEAFLAGAPALATGWSGNMEFMSGLAPLLIDFQLVPVSDPTGIYKGASQSWAEPSIDDAVQKLRNLAAFSSQRHDLARRGAEAVALQSAAWERSAVAATALAPLLSEPPLSGSAQRVHTS